MPAVMRKFGLPELIGGYWMSEMLDHLKNLEGIKIAVVTVYPVCNDLTFIEDNIEYITYKQSKYNFQISESEKYLLKCSNIVNEWCPDIVHVHGTERFYGLLTARNMIKAPLVISIQGILGLYVKHFFGNLSFADILKSHGILRFLTFRGLFWDYLRIIKSKNQELEIFRDNMFFMGRTKWDETYVKSINPSAKYFHVDEMLRPIFLNQIWNIHQCRRHQIIFTNARRIRNNLETMLAAVKILKHKYTDIKLNLIGGINEKDQYGKLLKNIIVRNGLLDQVNFLGPLRGDAIVKELCLSHVFVITSHIENSPNSLCEAMAVGLPCVANYVGGIPSLIDNHQNGLFYPTSEPAMLAECLQEIFENDDLAINIGMEARKKARIRHSDKRIMNSLLNTYNTIIQQKI